MTSILFAWEFLKIASWYFNSVMNKRRCQRAEFHGPRSLERGVERGQNDAFLVHMDWVLHRQKLRPAVTD